MLNHGLNKRTVREQWPSHEKSRTVERKAGSNQWRSAERMSVMCEEGRGWKGRLWAGSNHNRYVRNVCLLKEGQSCLCGRYGFHMQ